jgi:hypothetical protein
MNASGINNKYSKYIFEPLRKKFFQRDAEHSRQLHTGFNPLARAMLYG